MPVYKILSGTHRHKGVRYNPGDTVQLDEETARSFLFKMEKITEEIQQEAVDSDVEEVEMTEEEVMEFVNFISEKDEVDITSAARKLAESRGIPIDSLVGTGKDGRVTVSDVPRNLRLDDMSVEEIEQELVAYQEEYGSIESDGLSSLDKSTWQILLRKYGDLKQ